MIQQFPNKAKTKELTSEQLEAIIAALEQGGLMKAPPSLAQGTMRKIACIQKQEKQTPKTKQGWFAYRLKIVVAMAASLFLVFLPVSERIQLSAIQHQQTFGTRLAQGVFEMSTGIRELSQITVQQMMEVLDYEK